jgi:NDP-sugar pyrophosphorylase family protein
MNAPANNAPMPVMALLSGGLATRLRPITETLPKSLVTVGGEPFVGHQLRLLAREGFQQVVLMCGFLGEQIKDFVGDGRQYGLDVTYSFDGDTLRGTGGAIRKALPLLGERFMVMYGDSWLPTRYRPVWEFFLQSGKPGLMTIFENNDQWDKSNVEFERGAILRYDKQQVTPAMRYIDYGLGAFAASVFAAWDENEVFDLATVQHKLVTEGQLAGFQVYERFYEIGSHAGLHETDELMQAMYPADKRVQEKTQIPR